MRLLDYADLAPKGVKKSKCQLYRDGRAGLFPLPVRHGARNLWVESEIDAWIVERIAERDARVADRLAADQSRWPVKGKIKRKEAVQATV